jgi:hypothetical protein
MENVKYNVVRKFTKEYVRGVGVSSEIVFKNLTLDEANACKDEYNMNWMDACTDYYYVECAK